MKLIDSMEKIAKGSQQVVFTFYHIKIEDKEYYSISFLLSSVKLKLCINIILFFRLGKTEMSHSPLFFSALKMSRNFSILFLLSYF